MYNPRDIIEVLATNVKQTKSPFGIPKFMANKWWQTAHLPPSGEYMLFTGMMYQFTPFIDRSTRYLEQFEDSRWAHYLKFARYVPGYLSGIGLAVMTPFKEKRRAGQALKDIASLLKKSKVDFGYDPSVDNYSGVLLYDMGDQGGFVRHARFVAKKLKQKGVKKLITVDPHTTYALKTLFPKYTDTYFEVTPWFEMMKLSAKQCDRSVTIHDPCFYGRYLNVSDAPRKVLSGLGIQSTRIRNSGEFTSCCGGPAESISPALSKSIMETRVEELKAPGKPIVALCPICLGNLRKSGADVEDFSALVARHA